MIVARQFIAWYLCENGSRPVGHGTIGSDRRARLRIDGTPNVLGEAFLEDEDDDEDENEAPGELLGREGQA